jgi:diguanylate cyclase (GGDEF)-like protein
MKLMTKTDWNPLVIFLCVFGIISVMFTTVFLHTDLTSLFLLPALKIAWEMKNKTQIYVFIIAICILHIACGVVIATDSLQILYNLLQYIAANIILSRFQHLLTTERESARRDHLTKLLNSKGFNEKFLEEIQRFIRFQRPFSLIYIDVDNFKKMNDQFGHSIGDDVLAKIGSILLEELRTVDVPARMGGDEFVILLPETTEDQLKTVIEKLNERLLEPFKRKMYPITFSFGGMTFYTIPLNSSEAIHLVDQLMYSVKHSKKNGYVVEIYK